MRGFVTQKKEDRFISCRGLIDVLMLVRIRVDQRQNQLEGQCSLTTIIRSSMYHSQSFDQSKCYLLSILSILPMVMSSTPLILLLQQFLLLRNKFNQIFQKELCQLHIETIHTQLTSRKINTYLFPTLIHQQKS